MKHVEKTATVHFFNFKTWF